MTRCRTTAPHLWKCFGLLLCLGLFPLLTANAFADDTDGTDGHCSIQGPTTVWIGDSFSLAGPSGRTTYQWSGPGTLAGTTSQTLRVSGLPLGTHTFHLVTTKPNNGGTHSQSCDVTVHITLPSCTITGPSTVDANARFQLCGTSYDGASYAWSGNGLTGASRCLDVDGLAPGTYTFSLTVSKNGSSSQCTYSVRVVQALACSITGPTTVEAGASFQLCGLEQTGCAYSWSGPGIQSGGSSRCVTIDDLAPGTYTFTLTASLNGTTRQCTYQVTVRATAPQCLITGPSVVDAYTSFQICGPDLAGCGFGWSGNGVPSGSSSRCLTIPGLAPGTYRFTLTVTRDGMSTQCTFEVTVRAASPSCLITGPAWVGSDSAFTLCGPTGSGMTWSWSGPNLSGDTHASCVTVNGLAAGNHTFTLTTTKDGMTSTCTFTVHVLQRVACLITGPAFVGGDSSFTLCAPTGDGFAWTWTGPNLSGDTHGHCVTVNGLAPGTYTFTLVLARNGVSATCQLVVHVLQRMTCLVSGPSTVDALSTFDLCGPELPGATFSWSGPGIQTGNTSRCVVVSGLAPGVYDFTLVATVGGVPRTCTFRVTVRSTVGACLISGPVAIRSDSAFTLCGPTGDGLTWSWSGTNLSGSTHDHCVHVNGLSPGKYTFTLVVSRGGLQSTCTFTVLVLQGGAGQPCQISGSSTVRRGESFMLCGPTGTDLDYFWQGPSVPDDSVESRCVLIPGLDPGQYTYRLFVAGPNDKSSCTFTVNVTEEGHGASCPRPLSFWLRQVIAALHDHTDVLSREDLIAVAECIDTKTSTFNWDHDFDSFCALAQTNAWTRRTRVRLQFAVLLANVCAAERGLVDGKGDPIGLDPDARLTCTALGASTVGELIPRIASLLARCKSPLTFDLDAWRNLSPAYKCLRMINRGLGTEDGHCGDKEDDDLRARIEDAEIDADEPMFARATPNPFSSSTRLRYAIDEEAVRVDLGVYDVAGRLVHRLVSETQGPGIHEVSWSGTDARGARVRPGMYFVRGTVGAEPMSTRVMFLR